MPVVHHMVPMVINPARGVVDRRISIRLRRSVIDGVGVGISVIAVTAPKAISIAEVMKP
jgi:hypothetical protein